MKINLENTNRDMSKDHIDQAAAELEFQSSIKGSGMHPIDLKEKIQKDIKENELLQEKVRGLLQQYQREFNDSKVLIFDIDEADEHTGRGTLSIKNDIESADQEIMKLKGAAADLKDTYQKLNNVSLDERLQ